MLIEHYAAMARYNRWMNARIYELAGTLSDEERKRDLGAFFKSIHATLNHLLLADRTWLGRLSGDRTLSQSLDASGQPIAVKSLDQELYADFEVLRREREKTDADLERTVSSLTPEDLERSMSYRTSTGLAREHPRWWALSQVFNHQTHHRGQVTALFTRLGHDPGVTDLVYLLWSGLPDQPQTPPA